MILKLNCFLKNGIDGTKVQIRDVFDKGVLAVPPFVGPETSDKFIQ
jgi:hypothetical protein